MPMYRKKPVVIEAFLIENEYDSLGEVSMWCASEIVAYGEDETRTKPEGMGLAIKTLEGTMLARVGDYVIKGVQSEFYPCKPDIFEATYEKVE